MEDRYSKSTRVPVAPVDRCPPRVLSMSLISQATLAAVREGGTKPRERGRSVTVCSRPSTYVKGALALA